MKKLLIICGPTATGKTNLALRLAKLLPADIISADSRQVYIGADIVTGKDAPPDTKIYGIDLVLPSTQYNVSNWQHYALQTIADIHFHHRLPLVVGGTGLYIKSLVESMPTLHIPPNAQLRSDLQGQSATDLLAQLKLHDPHKAETMTISDQKNPRRLIRALEVATAKPVDVQLPQFDVHIIGLTCSLQEASKRIAVRVKKRLDEGAKAEYEHLVASGYGPCLSSIAAGYSYIDQPDHWTRAELQLFRRQMTWFKKQPRITWYDIENPEWQTSAISDITEWYSKIN